MTEFRRYEHKNDPSKTFSLFLATNYEDVDKAKKIADEIADILAKEKLPQREPTKESEIHIPSAIQEKEAKRLEGTYKCEEFDVEWVVTAEEKKGQWKIHLTPANRSDSKSLTESLPFSPKIQNNTIVFQLPGVFQVEPKSEGFFLCHGEKMAPTHFRRINPPITST